MPQRLALRQVLHRTVGHVVGTLDEHALQLRATLSQKRYLGCVFGVISKSVTREGGGHLVGLSTLR